MKNSANLRLLQDFGIATDDVAYSLSKKGRWVLPRVLKELILLGGFSDDAPNVQLTEKHKLKKTANCLGFYASKGPIKKAVPSRKRYFNVSSVKSMSFSPSEKKEVSEGNEIEEHPEPEISVEVYHPTPISSSITHNKKYIRHETDDQVRTKHGKPRQRHRTQIKFDLDLLEDDFEDDFWDEEEEKEGKDDDGYQFQAEFQRPRSVFTAADLLKSATKTRQIFDNSKKTRRKQSDDEMKTKAKIIHVSNNDELNNHSDQQDRTTTASSNSKPLGSQQMMVPRKIVLPTAETQPEFLKFIYGEKYLECNTFPRSFVINITEEVKDMMKRDPRMMHKIPWLDLTTVLVFTYDIYTATADGDVFDVYLNVNVDADRLELSTRFDFFTGSLECVIGQAILHVKSYKETQFARPKHYPKGESVMKFNALKACHFQGRTSTQEGVLEDAILSCKERNSLEEDSGLPLEGLLPDVCHICFDPINKKRSGIAMKSCGHWFCRECWRDYLLHQNFSRLLCPEFKCGNEVDFTLILQVLNITHVRKYLIRRKETLTHTQCTYCPNKRCGRVISASLSSHNPTNVVCECGATFCSKCLKFPHWPVSCETSKKYWSFLKGKDIEIDFDYEDFLSTELQVYGKHCPNCNQFIEKIGGCHRVICVCGICFCWVCRRRYMGNHYGDDDCETAAYDDKTTSTKTLKADPLLTMKIMEEPALIQTAIKQRAERANSRTALMRRKTQSWCQRIRTLGRKSSGKIADLLAGCESKGKSMLHKFETVLENMIELYLELRYLTEYTAVFTHQQKQRSQKRLKDVLTRMDHLASEIYAEFQRDVCCDLSSLVESLLSIKDQCMCTVSRLIRIINEIYSNSH
jgi:hypothetical protein